MGKAVDHTGKKYHRLTAIKRGPNKGTATRWFCRCDCGTELLVHAWAMVKGHTKSCGCQRVDSTIKRCTTHGYATRDKSSRPPEYEVWSGAKKRCYTKSYWAFHRYGGRGISMCDRWRYDFSAFLKDMGPRPSDKHSIERNDNDGNYTPANCRWATRVEQANNKINNRRLTIDNVTMTTARWSLKTGIDAKLISARINNLGWPVDRAVFEKAKEPINYLTLQNVTLSVSEWAKAKNMHIGTLHGRLRRGWSVESALSTPVNHQLKSKN